MSEVEKLLSEAKANTEYKHLEELREQYPGGFFVTPKRADVYISGSVRPASVTVFCSEPLGNPSTYHGAVLAFEGFEDGSADVFFSDYPSPRAINAKHAFKAPWYAVESE